MIHCIYDHPMVRQDKTEAPPASLQDLSSNISALHPGSLHSSTGLYWEPLTSAKRETPDQQEGCSRQAEELWFPFRHTFPFPLVRKAGSLFPHNIAWLWRRPPRWLTQQKGFIFPPGFWRSKEEFLLLHPGHKPGAMTGQRKRRSGFDFFFSFHFCWKPGYKQTKENRFKSN